MKLVRYLFIAICIISSSVIPALAQVCDADLLQSPAKSLALLREQQDTRQEPKCIQMAIYGIRGTKSPQAIEVLVKYLDFRRPSTPEEQFIRRHLITVAETYPAVDALYGMGNRAIPRIVSFISAGPPNDISRTNALVAMMQIYRGREPEAILRLKSEAAKTTDSSRQEQLNKAAAQTVDLCSSNNKDSCMEALRSNASTAQ